MVLTNIYISSENNTFTSINGILFSKDKKRIIAYPLGKTEDIYNIPDGVKVIGTHAFANNTTLKKVVLPDTLEEIGKSAFSGCQNLESIDFPSSLSLLYQGAFEFCHKLKSVTIPENVSSIGNNCFALCYVLEEIYILNPECKINGNGNGNIISNKMIDDPDGSARSVYVFDGTIYGYEGTATQEYAEKYGYKFESLGKYEPNTTTQSSVTTTSSQTTTTIPTTLTITSSTSTSATTSLTTTIITTTTQPINKISLGDVNNDNQINAVDASCILSYYAYVSTTKDEILPLEAFFKKK